MKQRIQTRFRRFILLRNGLRNQIPLSLFLRLQGELEMSIASTLLVEIKFPLANGLRGAQ